MKYRGVVYESEFTPMDMVESGHVGVYRGQPYNMNQPAYLPVAQSVAALQYRGVVYRTTPAGGVAPVIPTGAGSGRVPVTQTRLTYNRRSTELSAHQLKLQALLNHRLDVARARGDEHLVQQLEQEKLLLQ